MQAINWGDNIHQRTPAAPVTSDVMGRYAGVNLKHMLAEYNEGNEAAS